MSIDDRIKAVREAETAQMDAANRKVAEEEEKRRKQADEHRAKAEAQMPDIYEGVRLLRAKREQSVQLLATSPGSMRPVWQPGQGWSKRRRERRRKMIGWRVETRKWQTPPLAEMRDGIAAYAFFVPLQGPIRVIDTLQTIDQHVSTGIVKVSAPDSEKGRMPVEIHADKTVSALLEILAKHLALLGAGFE